MKRAWEVSEWMGPTHHCSPLLHEEVHGACMGCVQCISATRAGEQPGGPHFEPGVQLSLNEGSIVCQLSRLCQAVALGGDGVRGRIRRVHPLMAAQAVHRRRAQVQLAQQQRVDVRVLRSRIQQLEPACPDVPSLMDWCSGVLRMQKARERQPREGSCRFDKPHSAA